MLNFGPLWALRKSLALRTVFFLIPQEKGEFFKKGKKEKGKKRKETREIEQKETKTEKREKEGRQRDKRIKYES